MRILISGHHLVVKDYQELIQEIALVSTDNLITLITPAVYLEKKITFAETYNNTKFRHIKLSTVFGKQGRQHAFVYIGLEKVINNLMPDIIYCMEEPNSIVSLQFAYYAKKNKIPIVFWSALNQKRDFKKFPLIGIRRYLYQFCTNYVFNNSSAINAINNNVKDVLLWRGYKNKIFVQNTFGVNKEFFINTPIENNNFINLIYIGVLEEHKGVHILLEAIANDKEIQLTVIGDGLERQKLEEYAKQHNCNTNFIGYVDYSEVPMYLNNADILIMPSLPVNNALEQFGRVLIEAMASGVAIIASDIGEIPNTLHGNGLLFRAGNSIELKAKIEMLKGSSQKLEKLKNDGIKFVKEKYSNKYIASELIKELELLSIERS